MNSSYVIAALAGALGLGLLIFGASQSAEMTLLGLVVQPHITKGLGIIAMIFSIIMALSAYGSTQEPRHGSHRG